MFPLSANSHIVCLVIDVCVLVCVCLLFIYVCVWHRLQPSQQQGWEGSLVKVSVPRGFSQTQLSKLAHNPYQGYNSVHTFACVGFVQLLVLAMGVRGQSGKETSEHSSFYPSIHYFFLEIKNEAFCIEKKGKNRPDFTILQNRLFVHAFGFFLGGQSHSCC